MSQNASQPTRNLEIHIQFWVLGSINDFDLYPIVELSSKKQEEWNKTYKKNSPSIYQITLI